MEVEVQKQAELDAVIGAGNVAVCLSGKFSLSIAGTLRPRIILKGSAEIHVEAWGSSQPHVEARESSQPHVVAWGSSQPHVVARESSQPHVVARGSSQPHVEASGYVQLSTFGRVIAKVTALVSVLIHGRKAEIEGGRQTIVERDTARQWCDYYGVEVIDGVAILVKALDENFKSPRGFSYIPGSVPEAPDWDGGKAECGGGLHFSPTAGMAMEFAPEAKRFAACPVALADMAIHPDGDYPQKIKASRCCGPVYEIDRYGKRVEAPVAKE